MKRYLMVLGMVAVLSACGSAVKLDNNVPVVDKTGTTTSSVTGDKAGGSAAGSGTVTTVYLSKSGQDAAAQGASRVIYFDFDSAAIRPEFQSAIEMHARYLRADKSRKVMLEGHTDERGGREYNLALGQKRAEAVRKVLSLLGVPENQMEAVSFGKEKPAVSGSTEEAMQKNRRVEMAYR